VCVCVCVGVGGLEGVVICVCVCMCGFCNVWLVWGVGEIVIEKKELVGINIAI